MPSRFEATLRAAALLLVIALVLRGNARAQEPTPVFLFLVDTVRTDSLHSFNPAQALGAQIERLAADGIAFDAARSNSSWTRTAVATLLTGLPEQRHGVYDRGDVLGDDFVTLAEILRQHGYRTAAWSANPNVLPLWGFGQGFDHFVDAGASTWGKESKTDAATLLRQVREFRAEQRDGPWFYYVHLMDAHAPYLPAAQDLDEVRAHPELAAAFPGRGGGDAAAVRAEYEKYLAEIRGMDREIGAFLDELRREGAYDRALILLLADHGEEFLDHGGTDHGKTLYEEVLRVPAILKLPGNRGAGTRVARPVAMEDFLPTLTSTLGFAPPAGLSGVALWNGSSVSDPGQRALVASLQLDQYHQQAILAAPWKLIRGKGDELYDLGTDPRETKAVEDSARKQSLGVQLNAAAELDQQGWHLRLCGGDEPGALHFLLATDGWLHASSLEQNDKVAPMAPRMGHRRYDVTLSFKKLAREGGDAVPDEDELRLVGVEGAVPDILLNGIIRYAVGRQAKRVESANPQFTSVPPEAKALGAPPCFGAGEERKAYLRIWFVPAAEKKLEADIDPAVRERLRALGYSH